MIIGKRGVFFFGEGGGEGRAARIAERCSRIGRESW